MSLRLVSLSQVLACMMAWDIMNSLQACTFCSNYGCLYSCNSPLLCRMGTVQAVMHPAARDRSLGLSHNLHQQVPIRVALAMIWSLTAILASSHVANSMTSLQAFRSRCLPEMHLPWPHQLAASSPLPVKILLCRRQEHGSSSP